MLSDEAMAEVHPNTASLAFRFAQTQLDDHVRNLRQPHAATDTLLDYQSPNHAASHTPSQSSHTKEIRLLTRIFTMMYSSPQCASTAVEHAPPLPHPPQPLSITV